MNNVIAVIVTYNRLNLLKEAVAAVKAQTYPPDKIIVVDNGCTDGTGEWLESQYGIEVLHVGKNTGASGGFYEGIKAGALQSREWIWVMDDDTICSPDALAHLMNKTARIDKPIGFIGSKCVWEDGEPHMMNVPAITPRFNNIIPFNKYDDLNLLLTETSSWVSLLLNVNAVKEVGLPYKEFFFWSDDCEYTGRISKAGYLGLYCADSVVLHKTFANYFPDFCRDTVPNIWKHIYGLRNEFFLKKKYRGYLYYFFWLIAKVGYTTVKILVVRKKDHFKFIAALYKAAWQSLFFNPKVNKVTQTAPLLPAPAVQLVKN